MRYQLLDYCYGVVNRTRKDGDGSSLGVVPEDVRVAPFDSLFEQRVFNRIVDRGYTVHPQFPAQGYMIDMVIIGAKGDSRSSATATFGMAPTNTRPIWLASVNWNAAAGSSSASGSRCSTPTCRPRWQAVEHTR